MKNKDKILRWDDKLLYGYLIIKIQAYNELILLPQESFSSIPD